MKYPLVAGNEISNPGLKKQNKTKQNLPEKNSYVFFREYHPKQTSYNSLKKLYEPT